MTAKEIAGRGALNALAALLLMLSLGALGVPAGYFPCLGIVTAISLAVITGTS